MNRFAARPRVLYFSTMRQRSYDYIAWHDEGMWTAHSPSIPGVYGLGATRGEAEQDLFAGIEEMFGYLKDIGVQLPVAKRVISGTVRVQV